MAEQYIYEMHLFNCLTMVYGKASFKECCCDGPARLKRLLDAARGYRAQDVDFLDLDRQLQGIETTRRVGQGSP